MSTSLVNISPWLTCYCPRPNARVRLVCFPHGGGGPQAYQEWSDLLNDDIEVFSVSLPGRGSRFREPPVDNMDALTDAILKDFQQHLDKPFAFFGHSVGALVCYDVARKMEKQGLALPLELFLSAHPAPHLIGRHKNMHQLSDGELIAVIKRLGLVPEDELNNSELTQLILPPMKADFAAAETYQATDAPRLQIPITALGGSKDELVNTEELHAWRQYSSAQFAVNIYEGDHFYIHDNLDAIHRHITNNLNKLLATLPPSILDGPIEDYPLHQCLHELFSSQAARTPDALALVDIKGRMTYSELDAVTDLLARYLQQQGVGVDTITGIYMETCLEYVVAYLAILKAGGAYMPVETAYPPELLEKVLTAAAPVLVLTNTNWLQVLPGAWQNKDRFFVFDQGWQDALQAQNATLPVLDKNKDHLTPDSLAYCVMSSGTTGAPKGIICPHRGAVNSYYWRYTHYPYQQGEREASNIFFVWEVIRPLLQGFPSYVIPDEVIYDPYRLVVYLSKHRIARVLFTPSLLEQVLNTPDIDLAATLKDLRIVWLNGEVVATPLVEEFTSKLPNVKLINDYSISECHDVCTHELSNIDLTAITTKFAPVGPPMDNVRVYIFDELLRPVPWGMPGEIYVAGATLARGYLNEPERTAERFLDDPIRNDGSKIYRTGDVGRILANGHLEVQGRVEFMIKLRGYSIVLGAVEAAIAAHPAVNSVAVVTEDNVATEQPEYLVAYVVANKTLPDDTLEGVLRNHAKDKLPHYAVPSVFVFIDELPLHDVTGKLDRKKLPRPTEVLSTMRKTARQMVPKTQLEQTIVRIWAEVLRCRPQSLGDNFFDLGGHSLLAIQMVTKVSAAFGLTLSVVDVFHHPTVQAFVRHVAAKSGDRENSLGASIDAIVERTRRIKDRAAADSEIAIIGMACRFPDADNTNRFWDNLCNGTCSIRSLSPKELLRNGIPEEVYGNDDYIRYGALLENVDQFDPEFWGISRREASMMDPQHRIFLECCWEAFEDAGYVAAGSGKRTAVFGGCFLPTYLVNVLGGGGLTDATDPAGYHLTEICNDKDYLASRVAYLMGLHGPAVSIQASCSTALAAVSSACQSLQTGQCDTALAGAASITFPQGGYQYVEGYINSPDGHVRAFDADANGSVLGDGVGVVLLKRYAEAIADGDRPLAIIKGFAVNNDGNVKAGYSAPGVRGQAEVIAEAMVAADVHPETISYVEAHGTGTLIGDPIEVQALTEVFRRATDKKGFCGLGSVKPNIGHSNIAAGMAGLMKTVLSLHHRKIPPTIEFNRPNPEMRLEDSPFYINDVLREWETPAGAARRAGVSCFGIGGTNVHFVLEEAQEKESADTIDSAPAESPPVTILPLSAKTAGALEENRKRLIDYLQGNPPTDIRDIGYTLSVGREQFARRLGVSCSDHKTAIAALKRCQEPSLLPGASTSGVVFMFPGQGAQYLDMGRGLYAAEPVFQNHVDVCCRIVAPLMKEDLKALLFTAGSQGAGEAPLQQPHILQPALFIIEYGLAMTLIHLGVIPDAVMGHSIGEYVAACLAGIMSLEDALTLVMTRAHAIGRAPEGRMLAVQMTAAEASTFVAARGDLTLAVINSAKDIVLSGTPEAIAQAEEELEEHHYSSSRVQVNRPFHSPLLEDAARLLNEKATAISLHPPTIPMTSNLTGGFIKAGEATSPLYWGSQMCKKVRFHENVQAVLDTSPSVILEVGPGRILSTLVKRIVQQEPSPDEGLFGLPTLPHPLEKETTDVAFFGRSLATLWQHGIDIDWEAYYGGEQRKRVALPTYCFDKIRCWPDHASRTKSIAPTAITTGTAAVAAPQSQFYLPSWARSFTPTSGRPAVSVTGSGCRWWIFVSKNGLGRILGEQLCTKLERDGHQVIRIMPGSLSNIDYDKENLFFLDPENPHQYGNLVQKLIEEGRQPDRLVHLWSLSQQGDETIQASLSHFYHWSYFAQALVAQSSLDSLMVWTITNQVLQVDQEGAFPAKTTLLGPVLVLPQENPHISSRLIDVQLPEQDNADGSIEDLCAKILRECTLADPDKEPLVALRGQHRWVPRFEEMQLNPVAPLADQASIESGSTHIITGGLGRIGLTIAEYLANRQCNLVLCGRGEFPQKDQWSALVKKQGGDQKVRQTIEKLISLEKRGATVIVKTADVGDAAAVETLMASTFAEFNAVHGIFHAAGVANLRYMHELPDSIAGQEFMAKVDGVINIERAIAKHAVETGKNPLFTVLFSSMASVLGGLGMAAYAGANRFMDAFVQALPGKQGVNWVCINWDDWDFEYTKEQTTAYDKNIAQYALAPEEGIAALEQILGQKQSMQVMVTTRPLLPRVEQWLHQHDPCCDGEREGDHKAALQLAVPPVETHPTKQGAAALDPTSLEQQIAAEYKEVLGVETLTLDDDFFTLGGDSLLAARILMGIRRNVSGGEKIHLAALFDHPTVRQLAQSMLYTN